jgi:hypothetical protein
MIKDIYNEWVPVPPGKLIVGMSGHNSYRAFMCDTIYEVNECLKGKLYTCRWGIYFGDALRSRICIPDLIRDDVRDFVFNFLTNKFNFI